MTVIQCLNNFVQGPQSSAPTNLQPKLMILVLIYKDLFILSYNQYCNMISEQIKARNSFYLTPIKLKRNQVQTEEAYQELSLKKKACSTSTNDSPLTSPRKNPHSDSQIQEQFSCQDFQYEGFCCRGQNCHDDHTQGQLTHSQSILLNNYPELILMRPVKRIRSFLA